MKNLKSLQVVVLAGVAIAFTSGCSSTSMSANTGSDNNAAYRFASSGGWAPVTDVRRNGLFPYGWTPGMFGPVSHETYTLTPPLAAETTVTVASSNLPQYSESLQPGDAFVEAAGADSGTTKRVILYTPFSGAGLGH